ncbi:hypothetical protein LOAG_10738 [Loa loa]|uniref:Uncharacterized protein n=1 Tax=Loa loa TaxID=7209 RepID=A0A1S0TPA5_LOALO|nr:hypothetical protein LOAG_10738 [Loa loa]EFO17761.1 hypothetical protein LOAG_10738 [Loa loa]
MSTVIPKILSLLITVDYFTNTEVKHIFQCFNNLSKQVWESQNFACSKTFPNIPLSFLHLLGDLSITRVDYQVDNEFHFHVTLYTQLLNFGNLVITREMINPVID